MFKFRPTSISALILCCEDYQLPRNEVESGKAGAGRGKEYQIYFDIEPLCEKASKVELSQTELDWINLCLHLKEMIIEKFNNSGFAIYAGTGKGLWLIRFKLGASSLPTKTKEPVVTDVAARCGCFSWKVRKVPKCITCQREASWLDKQCSNCGCHVCLVSGADPIPKLTSSLRLTHPATSKLQPPYSFQLCLPHPLCKCLGLTDYYGPTQTVNNRCRQILHSVSAFF